MAVQNITSKNEVSAPTDFGSVFRAAPGMYVLLLPDAPNYTIITASDAYTKATSTKCDDLRGRGVFDAFYKEKDDKHAASIASLRSSLEYVIRELKVHEMDVQKYDVPHPDGHFEEKYWSPLNTPVFDSDGKLQYIIHRTKDITEKIRAEKERDRFFTLSNDLQSVIGFDGYFKKVNPEWEKILGWSEKELLASPFINFVHPDDRERTASTDTTITKGQTVTKFENRYLTKDGGFRWLSWKAQPFVDEKLIYCGATDITDRKKTEELLLQSEARYRQIANSMPQVVWTARPDGELDYVNDRCFEYSGALKTQNGTVDWTTIVHPDDLPSTIKVWTESVQTGKPYDVQQRIMHAESGEYRWNLTRALPIRNDEGNIIRWHGTNTDIEEQKRTYDALHESERFNQSIIDSSPDCIKVIDLHGNLLTMNEEGCKQMEVDDFSVCVNKPWIGFWEGVERAEAERSLREASEGKTARFEGFCATMKGTPKWWEVIVTPIFGKGEVPARFLSVSRDITTRKKLQSIAQEAQERAESANLAKSEFLANMSHEIRTPMNAVIGLSMILSKSEGLSPKQKEYIRTLQLSADSLLGLINDLLDISKIEARSIELEHIPFSITQLLNEVISMMSMRAKEKGLEFKASGECARHHMLIGDPMRLRQIILNLCSNSIKFTEKGGVYINISCEPSDIEGVENVSIAIRDTGIGIPPDKQETIFHKFIQADSSINRKYGGTGLGLAITKTLTEIMDGTIVVESVPGSGSTFTVTLPLMTGKDDAAPAENNNHVTPEVKASKPGHRVLLVEDYAANVLVAGSYLESFGYSYDVVDNGHEAVERAKSGNYLAILMDVQMHGINGFEATKLIRSHEKSAGLPRVPIIGMTAHALTGDRERCIAVGMDNYLSKPYNPVELEAMLDSYATPGA